MSEIPATLTYFCRLEDIGNVINRSALPLLEAHQMADPFLPNKYTPMAFTIEEMFEASVKSIAHAILGRSAPKGQPNHPLQKAIMRWRMEDRFNDEVEIRKTLQGLLPAMVEQAFGEAKLCHQDWINYVSTKRSVVLYEGFQSLSLWHSVGYKHRSVAVKFRCLEDSIFQQCVAVNYSTRPIQTVSLQDYIEHMIGNIPEIEFDNERTLITKNYAQRSEKEWRLIVNSDVYEDSWLEFSPLQVQSVYLGALVPDNICRQIDRHLGKFHSEFSVFKARGKSREYALEFDRLGEHSSDDIIPDLAQNDSVA